MQLINEATIFNLLDNIFKIQRITSIFEPLIEEKLLNSFITIPIVRIR